MLVFEILVALFFTAFFAGLEIAFISANKLLVELKRKRSDKAEGDVLARFYDKPAEFLSTMLVGHNIALVVFTFLLTDLWTPFIGSFIKEAFLAKLLITFIITLIVLVFAEYLPKTLFRLYADRILFAFAVPIRFFQFLLAIPTWVMTKLSNLLLKVLFKAPAEQNDNVFTRVDLEHFVQHSFKASHEEEVDTDLFNKALQLRNVKIKQCMIPRSEIVSVDVHDDIEVLRQTIRDSNHSRIIVTGGDVDNVLGYVHHQQMFKNPQKIDGLVMDMIFVPEAMKVLDLIDKFTKERINIACIVNEFGSTSGIITLEDTLEQLFGDIADEHDREEYVETRISDTEYIFSGRLEIDYINATYQGIQLPRGEYHTLSGYLVNALGDIPEQGKVIELEGYRFIPEIVGDTKIETVRVLKMGMVRD